MKYFKNQKCDFQYPVVAMGTFDGIHLGHQKLLSELKARAQETSGETVVITYYHHPLETIHRKTFPYLLTEKNKKEKLLKDIGIDCVLYLNFNEQLSKMSSEQFLKDILIGEIHAKEIIVGYDTHFGRFREGNFQFLKNNEEKYKYKVSLIEPLKINNRVISSSIIRDFVREGDMIDVRKCLGRYYSLIGIVQTGHRIGRELGFPTINVKPFDEHKLIPAIGVYFCEAVVDNKKFIGLTNVGYSPTLKQSSIKEVETHLIDFEGDLYHKNVEIFFHKRLRDELLFKNKKELVNAIYEDVLRAKQYFGQNNKFID
ncbi:MAG: bifunctional riboflavin kinase/FAD synthetase [Candidatus Cloacimonetes bacterium]|nr:bifunctional riboflavin kinase/FAD synthetase [Candidatus Cloacimonadota bacterium]